jgi:small subunit ribosomal protein S21
MASHHNALIVIDDQMPLERAITTLKKGMLKDGIFKEMKRREFYEKPSIKKRRKQTAARKRVRKSAQKVARALEEQSERIEARKQFGGRVYVAPKREVKTI